MTTLLAALAVGVIGTLTLIGALCVMAIIDAQRRKVKGR